MADEKREATGWQIEAAMSEVDRVRALLGDDDQDIALRLDTIEGQTEANELADVLVEKIMSNEVIVERARARAKRLEQRADRLRATVLAMLEKFGVQKLERPLYTASISHRSKALITDPARLPPQFIRHAPDLIEISKALRHGDEIPGAELSNPTPSLTIKPL